MKSVDVVTFALALGSAALSSVALARPGSPPASVEATDKRVSGIITAVDAASVCITTLHGGKVVTGRIDTARTKVVLDGAPAHAGDLQITYGAKAELGLDDVWSSIQATRR